LGVDGKKGPIGTLKEGGVRVAGSVLTSVFLGQGGNILGGVVARYYQVKKKKKKS